MARSGTILLVEDDESDVELTLRVFESSRIANEIIVARDGAEAVDYLLARGVHAERDPAETPELVLLDLKLPKIHGLGVLRRMRADERTRAVPVVVLTASNEESDVIASFDLGANSYLQKPVDFSRLVEAVRRLGLYWLLLRDAGAEEHPPG